MQQTRSRSIFSKTSGIIIFLATFNYFFIVSYLAVKNSFNLALSGDDWLMHWMTWIIFEVRKTTSILNPLAYLCTYCPHYPTLYFLDHTFGFDPFYYYFTSLVLRSLSAFTVFLVVSKISGKKILGFLSGTIYAVTYIGIETTDWVFNFVHYAGIPVALLFVYKYIRLKDSFSIKKLIIVTGMFALALIVSPPRMHGLFPITLILELVWLLKEGKKFRFKHAAVRLFFLLIVYRILFVGIGDLTLLLRDKYAIDITAGHDVYGYGSPEYNWSRVVKGYKIAESTLKAGRSDFLLYPVASIGNYIFPDYLWNSIPFSKITFFGRQAFSYLTYVVPLALVFFSITVVYLATIKAGYRRIFLFTLLFSFWCAVLYFTKKYNVSTISPPVVAYSLVGGWGIAFSLVLFFYLIKTNLNLAILLVVGIGWMVSFTIFPWLIEPLSLLSSSSRYSLQQGVGLAIWIGVVFFIVIKKSWKYGFRFLSLLISVGFVFIVFMHFSYTNKYLAMVTGYRSKQIDHQLWNKITSDVPTLDGNRLSVFYVTYEPQDYLIAEWAIRFGFPGRSGLYYQIKNERNTPFVILGNYTDLISTLVDGERLVKQGRSRFPLVNIEDVYSYHLKDGILENNTKALRAKLKEDVVVLSRGK